MPKTYVLDTNVLLYNPSSLFAFDDNDIVIPLAVIEEIDNQKKRQDEIGRNARVVSQELDALRALNRLSAGVQLPSGGTLRVELNHQDASGFPKCLNPEKHDNRILALAYNLGKVTAQPVILVSKDLNLRIKADVLGVPAEDFYSDKIDFHQLYSGVGEVYVSSGEMDQFYREGKLGAACHCGAMPHQFFLMKSRENFSQSALARHHQSVFWSLSHADSSNWGVKALNKEQKFEFELLLNDQVKVVTLVGRAGTGKTLIALAVGLEKVLEQNAYSRLLVTRPVTPMGEDLGYLPGTKEEKLRPWMQPIYDNLEFILRNFQDSQDALQELRERGVLE
ncbi:MAG: PhoH family protein, partial [Syntrophobacteraceae bacterium]|nr:PhoH family protein [Syntrophobacteraceae bacterium]